MILNEFEAVTNSANGPIIFTYYDESALSRSSLQYTKIQTLSKKQDNFRHVLFTKSKKFYFTQFFMKISKLA